ncbi:BTB/POZ domain-containing protein 17 isoform X1 [Tribolium castaneum]|uniref:BTB/POZ domain-containing protein 17 isoform X1 n=1 Tax=Tribolium castaneum TaxID=7070 RepID=UPI0000D55639|nr:PREDICTED: BTB/POZ domain-containing protein 17 isoform X1 [Tribolium castaneum]|eukprot:XP_008195211.1 PREDICTED: BTB/POZ domain-containing protein 17 isoform X1 [Tribolium castaneum]
MERKSDLGEPSLKNRRKCSPQMPENSCQIMVVDNSQTVLNILRNLYVERQMCDVALRVGNREHYAHRLILCAFSDVFQAMLMKPEWCEWHESKVELQELLPECEKVFHLFLEYFYTGKILITHTNVMPILALADKYIVKGLSRLCVDYMCKHVPHAASHNQLFLWLQYSIPCGHNEVGEKCQNYIKWNLESIANTPDFSNIDAEMLIQLLQENDVIVYNEMVLYNCVVRWLDLQKIKLHSSEMSANEVENYMRELVKNIMIYIRFPMMTPRELADLLLSPLIKQYKEFFVDRMAIGMIYHSGQLEQIEKISQTQEGRLLFSPRLYTSDTYSAVLLIENFNSLPSYHTSTFVFSSHMSAADCESDKINDWVVDLYPKGVWFKKCYLIVWQGTLEVPEEIISTVRLSLTCRELLQAKIKVKVAVLIYGIQGGVEHVMEVREKIHHFTNDDKVMNIDNLIPFCELNPCASTNSHDSPYLIGPNRNQLKLNIVITSLT